MKKREDLCLLFFRIGLGGVFLYFGIDKFFRPLPWTKWIPEWFSALLPIDLFTFIYILGVVETIIGLMVLIGFFTRSASAVAAAFLIFLIASFGFNEIMIRDFGLMFLALGLAIIGPGCYSLDEKLKKRKVLRKKQTKRYKR